MKTFIVMYAIFMLIFNLRGYKNLFRNKNDLQRDIDESMNKLEQQDMDKKTAKGAAIAISTTISFFFALFYTLAGNIIFDANKYMFIFSVFMAVYNVFRAWSIAKAITYEKTSSNFLSKILVPLNTVFICLFVYLYIGI